MSEEQVTFGGVQVVDAHVDWAVRYANTPTFTIHLAESIDSDVLLPLSGDGDNGVYIQEYDGMVRGFTPGSNCGNRRVITLPHEDGREVEGAWEYDHNTKRSRNTEQPDSTLTVTIKAKYTTGEACTIEKMKEIVDTFINGDGGSDTVSYWVWKRDKDNKWRRATNNREDYEGYIDPHVTLVKDWNHTWKPKRTKDVTDEDEVYSSNT